MITTSQDVLKTLGTAQQPENTLVALGYSAWDQGQLESELLDNAWLTTPADKEILFHTPIAERWRAAAAGSGYPQYRRRSRTRLMASRTILAFDFGTKSIGVAIGQEITRTARPLTSFKAQDGVPDWQKWKSCCPNGNRRWSSSGCRSIWTAASSRSPPERGNSPIACTAVSACRSSCMMSG